MHFLKEIPVHEMQKLRKEEEKKEGKKKGKKSKRRKEEWKNERRRVEEGKNNIPSYAVEWRGTERRGALEPWRKCLLQDLRDKV